MFDGLYLSPSNHNINWFVFQLLSGSKVLLIMTSNPSHSAAFINDISSNSLVEIICHFLLDITPIVLRIYIKKSR